MTVNGHFSVSGLDRSYLFILGISSGGYQPGSSLLFGLSSGQLYDSLLEIIY